MRPPSSERAFNALPPAVVALAGLMAAVEVVLWLGGTGLFGGPGGIGWRSLAIQVAGFWPEVVDHALTTGDIRPWDLARFVTYSFVQGSFISMMFAAAFLLAIGKMVGEAAGGRAVLVVFFLSAAVGALAYSALLPDTRPLFGAFPGVYGLIGGFTFLMWARLGAMGEPQMQAFSLIGAMLGIQLIFALLFGAGNDWVAELVAFGTGFALMPLGAAGGAKRALKRIRRR